MQQAATARSCAPGPAAPLLRQALTMCRVTTLDGWSELAEPIYDVSAGMALFMVRCSRARARSAHGNAGGGADCFPSPCAAQSRFHTGLRLEDGDGL